MKKGPLCLLLAGTFAWCGLAVASTLIGNPTVRLPEWNGSAVDEAAVSGLTWRFEANNGAWLVRNTGPCDLALGCTALGPGFGYDRLIVTVPAGTEVVTDGGSHTLSAAAVVSFVAEGAPSSVSAAQADQGIWDLLLEL